MDVILIAARKQEIAKLLKLLEESELEPELIDVDAIAFTNSFLFSMKDAAGKVYALIDFGLRDANINILDHGALRFSRDITFGGHDIVQFLKRKLQVSDEDAQAIQMGKTVGDNKNSAEVLRQSYAFLIQEIKTSLNYFYGQHPDIEKPAAICASGGLVKIDSLQKAIEQETKIPVLNWDPTETLMIGPETRKTNLMENKQYLHVCLGLALR